MHLDLLFKRLGILFVVFYLNSACYSQDNCNIDYIAFEPGEELMYKISYNWLFVWTDVGYAKLTVDNDIKFGQRSWRLRGLGKTTKNWDFFFKVRDVYESWIEPHSLRPIYYKRDVHEDDFKLDIRYNYNYDSMEVYSWSKVKEKPVEEDTIDIIPCTFDIISIIYYSRCLDVSNLNVGDSIPFQIVLDREFTPLYFRYLGKETIKSKELGDVRCLKFSALLVAGNVFKEGGEDLLIWVSDDQNKMPVYAESPIVVGKVKVKLIDYKNNKYPMNSVE